MMVVCRLDVEAACNSYERSFCSRRPDAACMQLPSRRRSARRRRHQNPILLAFPAICNAPSHGRPARAVRLAFTRSVPSHALTPTRLVSSFEPGSSDRLLPFVLAASRRPRARATSKAAATTTPLAHPCLMNPPRPCTLPDLPCSGEPWACCGPSTLPGEENSSPPVGPRRPRRWGAGWCRRAQGGSETCLSGVLVGGRRSAGREGGQGERVLGGGSWVTGARRSLAVAFSRVFWSAFLGGGMTGRVWTRKCERRPWPRPRSHAARTRSQADGVVARSRQ